MNKKVIVWMLGLALSLPFAFTSCSSNNNNNESETMSDSSATTTAPAETNTDTTKTTASQPTTDNPTVHASGNNMSEMHYDTETLYLKAGNKIHLTFINDASDPSMIHNIVISKEGAMQDVAMAGLKAGADKDYVPAGNDNVIAHTKMAKPGETVEVDFTAPAAGTYDFFCSYPGHFSKMNGKVVVEP